MTTNKTIVFVFLSIFALIISIALLVALSIYIRSSYIVLSAAVLSLIGSSLFLIRFLYRTFINETSTYKEKYTFWVMSYSMFIVVVLQSHWVILLMFMTKKDIQKIFWIY